MARRKAVCVDYNSDSDEEQSFKPKSKKQKEQRNRKYPIKMLKDFYNSSSVLTARPSEKAFAIGPALLPSKHP
jgi:hypothetical protein